MSPGHFLLTSPTMPLALAPCQLSRLDFTILDTERKAWAALGPVPGQPGEAARGAPRSQGEEAHDVPRPPGETELYLEDEAIRAGAVILVHLVDDQEDDAGEEGQGEEGQHTHLRAEVGSGGWRRPPTCRQTQGVCRLGARNRESAAGGRDQVSLDDILFHFNFS